ncbi:hypothetical protein PGT21_028488 [Puccinia graminis f. sp. tritici]|uniref:STEEP1 domain-containing protein n=2 Tax=Puccinia graminis f. sp. tritici TaxID=56615 RepID=E3LB55_PUCGT|nr:uncharacterized protein PGTG_19807 [Puccinia graminis f. sp. tritici CRL 75-36-700-3]EFP93780.1 hypothetical protein PGTG_19807 [Puccinia graminis f. sp. tritici CRL 75-36-700-3]KAA1101719.1 hypothetical protein PGT21_028488 [Puccinia graminis f. sp. tritici]KAA1136259.1 hypothetical protein PGTUg99_014353 [Puccinia graminis f. sp. tritici]
MPKIVSRSAISTSEDKQALHATSRLVVNYCLCGEFILVIDKPLSLVARRPLDASYVIRNVEPKRSYKLNTELSTRPTLVRRENGFEKQWRHLCSRCKLPIGYEIASPIKGDWTYIFPGSLTETQSSVPPSALDLHPVETLKEQIERAQKENKTLESIPEQADARDNT